MNSNSSILDDLIRLGLADAPEKGTSETLVPGKWEPPTNNSNTDDSFIEPKWFKLLQFYLTSGLEKGCMMFGPRGSGKSTAIRQAAKLAGAQVITLQCAANMQIDSLLGVWTVEAGATKFVEGPLAIAAREGAWLASEEANVVHPGVWSLVNSITDKTGEGLRLPTGEVIQVHPDFRLILLYNEGSQYAGTRDVNAALKRRLPPIYCTYPANEAERQMLAGMTGLQADHSTVEKVVSLANLIREADMQMDLSTDILARFVNVAQGVLGWQEAYEAVIHDMLGDPGQTVAQREMLREFGRQAGIESW